MHDHAPPTRPSIVSLSLQTKHGIEGVSGGAVNQNLHNHVNRPTGKPPKRSASVTVACRLADAAISESVPCESSPQPSRKPRRLVSPRSTSKDEQSRARKEAVDHENRQLRPLSFPRHAPNYASTGGMPVSKAGMLRLPRNQCIASRRSTSKDEQSRARKEAVDHENRQLRPLRFPHHAPNYASIQRRDPEHNR